MISWFDARAHKQFGEELAALVIEKMPLPGGADTRAGRRTGKPKKPQDVLRRMLARISEFNGQHRANLYKKAQFGNAFKWKLLEAGYEAEFADELAKELLIHFR